jgi:hypothetical protein
MIRVGWRDQIMHKRFQMHAYTRKPMTERMRMLAHFFFGDLEYRATISLGPTRNYLGSLTSS